MSGLSRTPGKRVYVAIRTVGSNPTLSANHENTCGFPAIYFITPSIPPSIGGQFRKWNMTDLKSKSDPDLAEWTAGWKPGTKNHILGTIELDRRKNLGNTVRGWTAIGISLLALVVAVIALVYKHS